MRNYALVLLLVLFLSVSMTVTAENLDGFTNSQETILTQTIVGSETDLYMTAVASGGVAVLSVCLSEQITVNKDMLMADIGLEMGTGLYKLTNRKITVYKTEFG